MLSESDVVPSNGEAVLMPITNQVDASGMEDAGGKFVDLIKGVEFQNLAQEVRKVVIDDTPDPSQRSALGENASNANYDRHIVNESDIIAAEVGSLCFHLSDAYSCRS